MALKAGYHGIKNISSSQIMTRSEQEILGAKNFLKPRNTYDLSEVSSGVTYTFYADGSVKANGTATADSYGSIYQRDSRPLSLNAGDYIFSCPFNNASDLEILIVCKRNGANVEYGKCKGTNEVIMHVQDGDNIGIVIHIFNGKTVTNLMLYPMIRLASDPDSKYVPFAMTNYDLTLNRFEKGAIPSSVDLDDVTETGIYKIRSAPVHSPENTGFCSLIVNTIDTNQCIQIVNKHNVMYQRRKYSPSTGTFEWSNWYKFTGTEVTPASLTSASPETRSSDAPELTEDEPIVKKTTKKTTKKTEEV